MSYLNPPYDNNFKELCASMPLYYLDVREMRAILRAQGRLLDGNCAGMEKLVDVNFILTADDATLRLWEQRFKITYKRRLTIEQRRRVVIGYIIGFGHIGEPEIRAIIAQYTPNHVDFDFQRGNIIIFIDGEIFDEDNMLTALLRRIPAHLSLGITVHVRRQYKLDLPLIQGGASNIQIHGDPAETRETILAALTLSQSAASVPEFTSDTPSVARTGRTHYRLQQSGAATAENDGGDTPPVQRTVMEAKLLSQSGVSTAANGGGDTPQVQRTITGDATVSLSGFEQLHTTTDIPETKRAATGQEMATGGLFCYTRIKSKRID